jgi:hypothetical protein
LKSSTASFASDAARHRLGGGMFGVRDHVWATALAFRPIASLRVIGLHEMQAGRAGAKFRSRLQQARRQISGWRASEIVKTQPVPGRFLTLSVPPSASTL